MVQQIVFLDLETSGLDPLKNGILEIGALFLEEVKSPRLTMFQQDVNPGHCEFQYEALQVNGFTPERVQAGMILPQAIDRFQAEVCRKPILAGWNAPFDAKFLQAAYYRCGVPWPFDHHTLDVWSLFHSLKVAGIVEGHLHLSALTKRYNTTTLNFQAHTALGDVQMTYALWRWAMRQLELLHGIRQGYARL